METYLARLLWFMADDTDCSEKYLFSRRISVTIIFQIGKDFLFFKLKVFDIATISY